MTILIVLALMACGEDNSEPVSQPEVAPVAENLDQAAPVDDQAQAEESLGNDWVHYGEDFTVASSEAATALLASPNQYIDQTVRVTGRVADVCQKAGCWMVIAEEDKLLRVIMKDHAFAVHKAGAGGEADIEGLIVAKAIDPKTIEHYKGESEHPDKIPEANVEGETTYELVASAVSMRKAISPK